MLTILVNTYAGAPLHHMAHLVRSNPTADIRIVVNHAPQEDLSAWMNCDRAFRDWWRLYGHTVKRESTVVLLEQDVLVTKPLPELFPYGFVCKKIEQGPEWYWWDKHVPLLPERLRQLALGMVPLAVLFTRPHVLDQVFARHYDGVYAIDMISELRLGTLAHDQCLDITEMDMPGAHWHPVEWDYTDPVVREWGIYHAVKKPVDAGLFQ